MRTELLFLHCKAKYTIVVEKHDNGCTVKYPANFFIQPNLPARTEKYDFIDDTLILSSTIDKDIEVKIHGYDNRYLVATDLLLKTIQLKISKELILFFDKLEPKKGIFSVLPPPQKEYIEKEKIIKENYPEIWDRTYFPADAEKAGILEGFNNINNLLAKGRL